MNDLVSRAVAGEDIVLTRDGAVVVRLSPIEREEKRALFFAGIAALQEEVRATAWPGPRAARSQDFLYNDDGLPG
ncbi:type II toxin-antitoxin system prevent-host-death family antitoxin [Jiella sp. MQZ9-1]|uniref:type II toxin-antitoxin system Phd/YefM family antitoxin n=1 Tax=Jiella flava TaxID=2816857 RepID=UPI001E6573F6|nr:type II toxin-antitoxin system prevent-host-death family antitoxin [Jiella flava]MCD2469998.1 type II toxin-antitoxin system prevent-host-death family antitoxin [Jiella flava]